MSVQLTRDGSTGSRNELLYLGTTGPLLNASCEYPVKSFEVWQTPFAVTFASPSTPADCIGSSVRLGPSLTPNVATKTTPAQMKQLYGAESPPLPLTFVACVEAGASPPSSITISVTYDGHKKSP